MGQLTNGVRNVMHMRAAERADVSRGTGPPTELVGHDGGRDAGRDVGLAGRDAAGRFIRSDSTGAAEAMARMKIGLSPEQKRWVETEAARRGVPRTVVVRELLDQALTARVPFGAQAPVHDVAYDGDVQDVVGLDDGELGDPDGGDAAGGARSAGSGRGVRVPAVEVIEAEPVPAAGAGAGGRGGAHGRRAQYVEPGTADGRAGEPRRGVRSYVDPARQHRVEERVAVDSVRQAVGDPSAGESAGHMSHLPPGVGSRGLVSRRLRHRARGRLGGCPWGWLFLRACTPTWSRRVRTRSRSCSRAARCPRSRGWLS